MNYQYIRLAVRSWFRTMSIGIAGVVGLSVLFAAQQAAAQVLPIVCPASKARTWANVLKPNEKPAAFNVRGDCHCSKDDPTSRLIDLRSKIDAGWDLDKGKKPVYDNVAKAAKEIINSNGFQSNGKDLTPTIKSFLQIDNPLRFIVDPAVGTTKTETVYCISTSSLAGYFSGMQNGTAQNWRTYQP